MIATEQILEDISSTIDEGAEKSEDSANTTEELLTQILAELTKLNLNFEIVNARSLIR